MRECFKQLLLAPRPHAESSQQSSELKGRFWGGEDLLEASSCLLRVTFCSIFTITSNIPIKIIHITSDITTNITNNMVGNIQIYLADPQFERLVEGRKARVPKAGRHQANSGVDNIGIM